MWRCAATAARAAAAAAVLALLGAALLPSAGGRRVLVNAHVTTCPGGGAWSLQPRASGAAPYRIAAWKRAPELGSTTLHVEGVGGAAPWDAEAEEFCAHVAAAALLHSPAQSHAPPAGVRAAATAAVARHAGPLHPRTCTGRVGDRAFAASWLQLAPRAVSREAKTDRVARVAANVIEYAVPVLEDSSWALVFA